LSTLEGGFNAGVASITKRESPISLNDKGIELLENSGAKEFVDNNKTVLIEKIKVLGHGTAYDIQENARKSVMEMEKDSTFNPLKKYAFDKGTDLSLITVAASLYLRDIALPEFGFSLVDVDISKPAKGTV
jgi:hypothetical protein